MLRVFRVWLCVAVWCVVSFGVCSEGRAEDGAEASDVVWTVQVDPLTTALGYVHVQLERGLGERVSVYVGPHLRLFDGIADEESASYTGYGVEVGVRWFFRPSAPVGWWLGVRGVGALAVGPKDTALAGYGSALAGYTGVLGGWLVLSGGAGAQYIHYRVDGLGPKGWFPALHTAVGVAW